MACRLPARLCGDFRNCTVTEVDRFDEHDAALVETLEAQLAEAAVNAMEMIPAYPPFSHLPSMVNGRMLAEFARIAETRVVSKIEMQAMLQNTLPEYLAGLRMRALQHPNLGSMRIAVLVHVAMVIGLPSLLGMHTLWIAVKANRWDEGARVLLKSHWPGSASTETERDRIVDIADIFRTGMAPMAWTT